MPKSRRPSGHSGFSLIELIVAMVVTMLVVGAVYGLMAGGNNAFRREPELTDRQQNARVAVEMIQKDISNAGVNLGPFFQSFSRGLNGVGRVTGPQGQVADHLVVFGNDGTCPDSPTNQTKPPTSAYNGNNIVTAAEMPDCYADDALTLVLFSNGGAKWGLGHNKHAGNQFFNFPPGLQPDGSQITSNEELHEFRPGDSSSPIALSPLNMVRYEIGFDPPSAAFVAGTSVPSLYRSATGGTDPSNDGVFSEPDSAANITAGRWQLLARGVEDLQVQYRDGTGAWTDEPAVVTCGGLCNQPTAAEYNSATREVRVAVSVRAEAYNLQGQTRSAASGRADAVRGTVTTVTSVKALQNYLTAIPPTAQCPTCPVWR